MRLLMLFAAFSFLTSAALAAPVKRERMRDYCRAEVTRLIGVRAPHIKTSQPSPAADGGLVVQGVTEGEDQGKRSFQCEFDQNGEFVRLRSLAGEEKN